MGSVVTAPRLRFMWRTKLAMPPSKKKVSSESVDAPGAARRPGLISSPLLR